MGFLKKKDDGGDDSNRLALFGSRSKSKSPAPPSAPSDNPYAQNTIPSDPYTRAKMNAGVSQGPQQQNQGPPPRQNGHGGDSYGGSQGGGYGGSQGGYGGAQGGYGGPRGGYGASQDGYSGSQGGFGDSKGPAKSGYAPDKYANQGGYGGQQMGSNPYGGAPAPAPARSGGYGGLGPSGYDAAPDPTRDQLFGGAKERIEQKQQGPPPNYDYNPSEQTGADRSYGAYGDRQLTAEEEEEEDIQATKQDIKFMKQQDVASTRNALRMAAQAEETGRNTLARLGAQGERMHNTDRNLDIGMNHINIAEDRSKELKTLNRSMFAVHVNNPFNAKSRQADRDERILDRHRSEREQREATREQAFQTTQRMNQKFSGLENTYNGAPKKANLAERSKYQFEADSDDDRMEDEIDRNLDDLSGAARRLNLLARATGEEVEQQNKLIDNIAKKSDKFDDRITIQTEKLKRIH